MIEIADFVLNRKQESFAARLFMAASTFLHLRHRQLRALRKPLHGLGKFQAFVHHQETKNITALPAAEAIENLLVWINEKRRSLFLGKWTQALEGNARAFELHVSANDFDDVIGASNLFDKVLWKQS